MNAVTEVMDELRKALSEVDDIRASLRRKVRHCDELIEERDQMERERDEARERNTDLRKMLEQTARALNHAEEAMVRLETQRDEARAALATCPDCVMYAKRSARFAEQADQLQRERDEARAEVERLRAQLRTVPIEFEPEHE